MLPFFLISNTVKLLVLPLGHLFFFCGCVFKEISSCPLAGSPLARSTVVTAIKFTIVDQPAPIDSLLKECIGRTQKHPLFKLT